MVEREARHREEFKTWFSFFPADNRGGIRGNSRMENKDQKKDTVILKGEKKPQGDTRPLDLDEIREVIAEMRF